LLGDGGARKAAGWGLGARLFAGEKCCWRVEKAGRLNCDSCCCGWALRSSEPFLVGGRRAVEAVRSVEDDLVRECPGHFEDGEIVSVGVLSGLSSLALNRW